MGHSAYQLAYQLTYKNTYNLHDNAATLALEWRLIARKLDITQNLTARLISRKIPYTEWCRGNSVCWLAYTAA